MTGQTKQRARPWERNAQQRSADIHRENRARIAREREAMAARLAREDVAGPRFKIRCDAGESDLPQVETKARQCLRCERPFQSSGAGNRMCDGCRRLTEGINEIGVAF